MVRPPYFDINGMKRGAWSEEEDNKLRAFMQRCGRLVNWRLLPSLAGKPKLFRSGLARCGKSCRLRWVNYLQPGLRKGNFTKEEEDLIIKLHDQLGNKWSAIAANFPGRTDNDIKNHWHAHIKKRGKRNRAICAKIEQSSEINGSKKPNEHQEETTTFDAPTSFPEITNPLDKINGHDLWTGIYDHLPPLIQEEEFPVSGVCTPTFSDSSGGTYDHLSPLLDVEFFEFGLCPNEMSNSSESGIGITCRSEYEYGDDTIDMVLWQ